MKKFTLFCVLLSLLFLCACGSTAGREEVTAPSLSTGENDVTSPENTTNNQPQESTTNSVQNQEKEEENTTVSSIEIIVGNQTFTATLYDNETAKAFQKMLPLTLTMSELNGNEKYYYLSENLPTYATQPSGIREGDLMLFGSSCLVLFYENFSTSYRYTPLGYLENASTLAAALGTGSVQVTFRVA